MVNTLAIDMINLDHTYLCYNGEIIDNGNRRHCNIRPACYDNRIDLENTSRELITYHTNTTPYCYESLLATYINKYLTEVESMHDTVHTIVFTIPHTFNRSVLDCAMTHVSVDTYRIIYDYEAAATVVSHTTVVVPHTTIVVPSEFETTILANNTVTVIPFGSHHIKTAIQHAIPYAITLDDAWKVYKHLQMLPKVNISDIIMSIDQSFEMSQDDLKNILASYYTQLQKHIDSTMSVGLFRWLNRDVTCTRMFNNIIRTYNPDEAICIAACNTTRTASTPASTASTPASTASTPYNDTYKYIDTYEPSVERFNDECTKIHDQVCFNDVINDYMNAIDEFLIATCLSVTIYKINKSTLLYIHKLLVKYNWPCDHIDELATYIQDYLQKYNLCEVDLSK